MFTWFPPELVMFSANLSGFSPACVLTGLLKVSKLETETYVGSKWNWMSSFFCWSLRELRKPGLRLEKALSFGANRVRPPLVVRSWELIWLETCVAWRRRIRVVNPPAFLRILMMSVGGAEGAGAGAAAVEGVAGAVGAAAGDWAKVVVEWEKSTIRRSGRDFIITIFC